MERKRITDYIEMFRKIREQEALRKQEIAQKNEYLRKQIAEFEKKKQQLELEKSEIKGLFAGVKKKSLDAQIDEINAQINLLKAQIVEE